MPELVPVAVPRENVNDETVTLVSWYVTSGSAVKQGLPIAQIETSKTTIEIEAPVAGTIHYTISEGQEVPIGAVICQIGDAMAAPELEPVGSSAPTSNGEISIPHRAPVLAPEPAPAIAPEPPPQGTRFSRKATELVERFGLDPRQFAGKGLVRSRDILRRLEGVKLPPPAEAIPPVSREAQPAPISRDQGGAAIAAAGVAYRSERLPRAKRTEIRAIRAGDEATLASVVTVPCRTRGLRAAARKHELIGENASAIVIYEVARLLRKYPVFNAFYADDSIHYYDDVNIGFAVDAGRGLKVPVIHQADHKEIAQIAEEMRELVVAYLGDELPVETLAGGTFTLTDLSAEGVLTFHPLINKGQAAILGVGGEVFWPGASEGLFNLILAFDHQLVEGRSAARFLGDLRQRLEAHEAALRPTRSETTSAEEPCCSKCRMTPAELEPYGRFLVTTVRSGGIEQLLCTGCLRGY